MKSISYSFVLCALIFPQALTASPSEKEILGTFEKYLILNNPNILDDLSLEERFERTGKFNKEFKDFSENLGKEEVFYYMKLSEKEGILPYVRDSAILLVPLKYLEHFSDLESDERRRVGSFIWEQKLEGNLFLRHLRKVEFPPVLEFLEEQYAIEGGPRTGRGYQIKKILDEIAALDDKVALSAAKEVGETESEPDDPDNPVNSPENPKNQPND